MRSDTPSGIRLDAARSGLPARLRRRAWLQCAGGWTAAMLVPGCGGGGGSDAGDAAAPAGAAPAAGAAGPAAGAASTAAVRVATVASGLDSPWGLVFLPEGGMLVTERLGRLRRVGADGVVSAPLAGVPTVFAQGQGGLLDVALDPDFVTNRTVYLTYAEPAAGDATQAGTAVLRARLDDRGLTQTQVIYRQLPKAGGSQHFGSRLAFARDGTLFVTLGERNQRDLAQDASAPYGKVVRIRPDGLMPPDNPFVGRADARPELWSLGHRNPQAAAVHPTSGALWLADHGAMGGDEVNVALSGRNYGWPVATYGVDYTGAPIGAGPTRPGIEPPLHHWDPSIAPSGMAFVDSDRYPGWRGSLLVGALAARRLMRLTFDGTRLTAEESLLQDLGERIRDVRMGPDGLAYLLTDSQQGRVLRLDPA